MATAKAKRAFVCVLPIKIHEKVCADKSAHLEVAGIWLQRFLWLSITKSFSGDRATPKIVLDRGNDGEVRSRKGDKSVYGERFLLRHTPVGQESDPNRSLLRV